MLIKEEIELFIELTEVQVGTFMYKAKQRVPLDTLKPVSATMIPNDQPSNIAVASL